MSPIDGLKYLPCKQSNKQVDYWVVIHYLVGLMGTIDNHNMYGYIYVWHYFIYVICRYNFWLIRASLGQPCIGNNVNQYFCPTIFNWFFSLLYTNEFYSNFFRMIKRNTLEPMYVGPKVCVFTHKVQPLVGWNVGFHGYKYIDICTFTLFTRSKFGHNLMVLTINAYGQPPHGVQKSWFNGNIIIHTEVI